jgi:hypothetical protein
MATERIKEVLHCYGGRCRVMNGWAARSVPHSGGDGRHGLRSGHWMPRIVPGLPNDGKPEE